MPGRRSRLDATSVACFTVRSGAVRSSSRAGAVQSALWAPPCTYRSWFSPVQGVGRTRSLPSPVVSERIAPLAGSSTTWKLPAWASSAVPSSRGGLAGRSPSVATT